jgi:uncharacterized surface protein with fasciclin (FAS1) repeats
MSNKGLNCLFGILLSAAMGACKKDNGKSVTLPQYDKNYYGRQAFVIALSSNYQNFDSALKKSGYIDTLAGPGPYTTFLVDNNAVGAWSYQLPANINFLLSSLILPGDHPLNALPYGRNQRFTTLAGNHLYVSKFPAGTDSATYLVNGQPVITTDIPATNGHIDVIHQAMPNLEQYSSVLAYVQGSTDLTFLALALKRTGLDKMLADTTKTWTLLAPVDAAFKNSKDNSLNNYDSLLLGDTAKLARILRYHILSDRTFYAEFTQALSNTDTATITPILAGATPIKFFNASSWPLYGYYFIGPGNWDNSTNPPTPHPAQIYQPVYLTILQDNIAVNGVIHQIDNILLP